ncbi:MAG TPA: hypothetical protein PKN56_06105 [Leptospiraceae bacterium]|nr:hypothetical protein [Leptospiraceae bacterium]
MELLKNLEERFSAIWNQTEEMFRLMREWKEAYGKLIHFWDVFFSVIPPELVFMILFTAFIMIILNNIFPTFPRFNLSMGVIIYLIFYFYFGNLIFGEVRAVKVIFAASVILLPAFSAEIFSYSGKQFYKKRVSAGSVSEKLEAIHEVYGEFLRNEKKFRDDPSLFFKHLNNLKTVIDLAAEEKNADS